MIDESALEPGERLLWRGRPDIETYCQRQAWSSVMIGLVVLAYFAGFATYDYFAGDAGPDLLTALAAPVVLLAFLAWRPLRVRCEVRRMSYALTDRRAIIDTPGMVAARRISVPIAKISAVEVHPGVFGDVVFLANGTPKQDSPAVGIGGFVAIANVQRVERLLQSAIQRRRARTRPRDAGGPRDAGAPKAAGRRAAGGPPTAGGPTAGGPKAADNPVAGGPKAARPQAAAGPQAVRGARDPGGGPTARADGPPRQAPLRADRTDRPAPPTGGST